MSLKKVVGLGAVLFFIILNLGCELTVTTPQRTYVKFHNNCKATIIGAPDILYKVKNISSSNLSIDTIHTEIAYGEYSVAIETSPHTGKFIVSYEVCPPGGIWVKGSDSSYTDEIKTGLTTTLELKLAKFKK